MKHILGKWLLVFPGEGKVVLYTTFLNFLIGAGMTLGSVSSSALFFKRFGVEYMPHMLLVTSLLLVAGGAFYTALADRMGAATLSIRMLLAVALGLLGLWLLMRFGSGVSVFLLYYLAFAVLSELMITHIDHYLSGFFDATQSKRLIPLIGAGQRLGGMAGGLFAGVVLHVLATEDMALLWGLFLLASALMIRRWHRHDVRPGAILAGRRSSSWQNIQDSLLYARQSSFLQITAAGVFVLIILVSVQEYLVSTIFTRHFQDARELAEFLGWLVASVNALALLLQIRFTGHLLHRYGAKLVNLLYPLSSVVSFALLAFSATLIPAMLGLLNYQGLLRAFRHPVFNHYFHGFPAYIRGRARAFIVGAVIPLGMALSGLLMMWIPGERVTDWLGWWGLGLSLVYLYIKVRKHKLYGENLIQLIRKQVFLPDNAAIQEMGPLDPPIVQNISTLLAEAKDEALAVDYMKILVQGAPRQAGAILLRVAPRFGHSFKDQTLRLLGEARLAGWQEFARHCLAQGDEHLRGTALILLARDPDSPELDTAREWLEPHCSVREREVAIRLALSGNDEALKPRARKILAAMLSSSEPEEIMGGLEAARALADASWISTVQALVAHPLPRVRAEAIRAVAAIPGQPPGTVQECLFQCIADSSPLVRAAAVMVADATPDKFRRMELLALAIHDPDFQVRHAVDNHVEHAAPDAEWPFPALLETYFQDFDVQLLILQLAAKHPRNGEEILSLALKKNLDMAENKKELSLLLLDTCSVPGAPSNAPPAIFLREVLNEEIGRHLEIALRILEWLDEKPSASAIRAAFESQNRHLRALALESLHHQEHSDLIERLLQLLESQHSQNWQKTLPYRHGSLNWEEILEKCGEIGSKWLMQCSNELRTT